MSPEYHEIQGVDGEPWLRVKPSRLIYAKAWSFLTGIILNCDSDYRTIKIRCPE